MDSEGETGRGRDESNFRTERSRLQSKNIIRGMVLSLLQRGREIVRQRKIEIEKGREKGKERLMDYASNKSNLQHICCWNDTNEATG